MNAPILQALRCERDDLVARWLGQFTVNRATSDRPALSVDEDIVAALFDDLVAVLACEHDAEQSGGTHTAELGRLAGFPDSLAVVIDLLQAGVQVLGAFAVENAGPFAAWSIRERNHFLGELDAVFPVLVRREVEALCAEFEPAPATKPAPAFDVLPRSALSRTALRRN